MNAKFSINETVIETPRLILRAFQPTDLDDFYEYASVAGVGEMAGWQHHANIEISKKILNNFIKEDNVFAIVDKSTKKVIGSLGIEKYGAEEKLTEFDNYLGREIGYVLSKSYWGQGLMTEAVTAVVDFLFNQLDFDFLISGHFNHNAQSRRVQQKCMFVPYRAVISNTQMETQEPTTLMLLLNPLKNIKLEFTHTETLIYKIDS